MSSIAIVVLTYNRVHLLPRCVENVLGRTSGLTSEIVIWNNGSTDGTSEYLDSLTEPRISVVHHERNIGQNAYRLAFALTRAPYMIEVDDDIIDAPHEWDRTLLEAFQRLPDVGYLAANLVNNPNDVTARAMYQRYAHEYRYVEENGVKLKLGRVGGGCTMTSREIHDRAGGFPQNRRLVFFHEAAAYIQRIKKLGYRAAYLDDLQVLHAGGAFYSPPTPERIVFFEHRRRRIARKNTVKRVLLAIPFVRPLNARYQWFQPPEART
jgi:GT2 family glycosyltransferase